MDLLSSPKMLRQAPACCCGALLAFYQCHATPDIYCGAILALHHPGLVLAGAAQADAALLVVDGSVGGFEAGFSDSAGGGGQTREHAQLARSLGIEQLAVVVTKLDTCGFSEVRFLLQPLSACQRN